MGYSLWSHKQSDMTEHNYTHTLKLLIGEYSQDVSQQNSQTKCTCTIQLHPEISQASSTQILQSKRLFIFES